MKNMQAKRTQAIIPLLKSAQRVILLSGTPALVGTRGRCTFSPSLTVATAAKRLVATT
jgi:hypothetical protein